MEKALDLKVEAKDGPKEPNYNWIKRQWLAADDAGKAELEDQYDFLSRFARVYRAYPKVHVHHLLPRKFIRWFEKQKIDIHDHKYLLPIEEGEHYDVHGRGKIYDPDWNAKWWEWIKPRMSRTDVSQEEIESFLRRLVREFQLRDDRWK